MSEVVYVTGNAHKAKHFAEMMKMNIPHMSIDVDEIQSMNLLEIVEHKAKQAYKQVKKPVIVEDTKLTFSALGGLPGPFIKWFQQEIDHEGLCRLLDGKSRVAFAGAAMAYFDGAILEIFEKELEGEITQHPSQGDNGFGWNVIFKPKGATKTFAEMDTKEFQVWYAKVKPFDELKKFLETL